MFLNDVNRPVDGAWRSPHAPTPHTDTPLHGATEATVGWHTHLPLVHSLTLRTPHPPLLCRPLSLPLSLQPLSSLLNLARVLVCLALSGCPAPHGFPGVLITPGWSGRTTTSGSRTQQPCNPFHSLLEILLQIWINSCIPCRRLQVFKNNNNLSAP